MTGTWVETPAAARTAYPTGRWPSMYIGIGGLVLLLIILFLLFGR
jgi:hypothetical protein